MSTNLAQNIRVAAPADMDDLKVVAYPWNLKPINISPIVKQVSWTEAADKAAIEGSLEIFDEEQLARKALAPGTWIVISIWDPSKGGWARIPFHMYVWERTLRDMSQATSTLTLLDVASFLGRFGSRTWVFKRGGKKPRGWTASEIAKSILDEFGIPHKVVETTYRIPFVRVKATPMEMIIAAFTEDRRNSKRKYRIQARGRNIVIDYLKPQEFTWFASEGDNLQSASWTESLEGVATIVRATSIGDNGIPRQASRVSHAPSVQRYGKIIETIQYDQEVTKSPKKLKELASKRLEKAKKLKKTAQITAEGSPTVRASDAIIVVDSGTGMNTRFFIESVSHSITPGSHQMQAELSAELVLPLRPVSKEERTLQLQTNQGANGGSPTSGGGADTHLSPYPILPTTRPGSAFRTPDAEGAPASNGTKYHAAVDWGAAAGTTVSAPASGTVVEANQATGYTGQVYGGTCKIQLSDGFVFVMRHMDPTVRRGQQVARGSKIGVVSRWDGSYTHVHLEVWKTLQGGYRFENMIDPDTLNWTTEMPATTSTSAGTTYSEGGGSSGGSVGEAGLAGRLLDRGNTTRSYHAGSIPSTPSRAMAFAVPSNYIWADNIERHFGLTHGSLSRLRSPSQNASVGGSPTSRHMIGGAADMSGSASAMRRCAEWAIRSRQFAEVFYDPIGYYWDTNGGTGRIIQGSIGGHDDHVHLSYGVPQG